VTQELPMAALSLAHEREPESTLTPLPRRKRGRPLEMQPHEVLTRIRELAVRNALFRVHLDAPALYARARRLFGTWAAALLSAGVDHASAVESARRRAVEHRRHQRTKIVRADS